MKQRFTALLTVTLLLTALFAPFAGQERAGAQGAVTLKIATLFPASSSIMRVLNAWKQSLTESTSGQVTLEFVSLGRTADEAQIVQKVNSGEYDGAVLTAAGLSRAVPASLVFGAPGVFADYADLDRARTRMASDVETMFSSAPNGGYKFLGWADVGRARVFSRTAFASRAELAGKKFWVAGQNDPIADAFARAVGGNPVTNVGIGGVARALEGGQLDTVYASALATVSLNWHTRFTHMTKQHLGFVVGATLLRSASWNRVPEAHRAAVTDTATRAHTALARTIRRDDDRNYQAAVTRGVVEVDLTPNRAQWDQAAQQARTTLTGRSFSAAQLQRASGR
jgi:TRAP-type C4-dicarboxylate transport system substrate-binding protein